jgi:Ca-activated chloride channel family protein
MNIRLFLFLLFYPKLSWSQTTLNVDVRMIEVYAAVSDDRGRPVTNLQTGDFYVLEDNHPQQIRVFERQSSAITIALLVDTTGSMTGDLPRVKNAVARLLEAVKPEDNVGLFTFASGLNTLSNFSTDRNTTLNAIFKARAAGQTALFDSLALLSRQISRNAGKKAILLFTDGDDNSSVLSLEASIKSVQRTGVPIYAVLYGRALKDPSLFKSLERISISTGGFTFKVNDPREVAEAFARVGKDMQNIYLIGYQSDNDNQNDWHGIKVILPNHPKLKLRAKEGYWP